MFLWDRNKFVSSANITSIKGFDALNRSFKEIKKVSGLSIDFCRKPKIISRKFLDTSWEDMYCFLLLAYVVFVTRFKYWSYFRNL